MAKKKLDNDGALICQTCGKDARRLYQSYVSGKDECGTCALEDPYMNAEQAARIRRHISRAEQARKNFKHGEEVAA